MSCRPTESAVNGLGSNVWRLWLISMNSSQRCSTLSFLKEAQAGHIQLNFYINTQTHWWFGSKIILPTEKHGYTKVFQPVDWSSKAPLIYNTFWTTMSTPKTLDNWNENLPNIFTYSMQYRVILNWNNADMSSNWISKTLLNELQTVATRKHTKHKYKIAEIGLQKGKCTTMYPTNLGLTISDQIGTTNRYHIQGKIQIRNMLCRSSHTCTCHHAAVFGLSRRLLAVLVELGVFSTAVNKQK